MIKKAYRLLLLPLAILSVLSPVTAYGYEAEPNHHGQHSDISAAMVASIGAADDCVKLCNQRAQADNPLSPNRETKRKKEVRPAPNPTVLQVLARPSMAISQYRFDTLATKELYKYTCAFLF